MKYGELIRKLRRRGIEYYRDAKGSHEIWWDPTTGLRTTIPRHPGKEIKKRTLAKILGDLGLKLTDL